MNCIKNCSEKWLNVFKENKIFISVLSGLLFTVLFSALGFTTKCADINNSVLRVHIIANSDSQEDQALKLKVRDNILKQNSDIFEDSDNIETAKQKAVNSLEHIKSTALDTIKENGYDYEVDTSFVNMYFNTRHYDNISLPSGYYDAVRIVIGEGKGQNWWCVLYPSMCLSAAADVDKLGTVLDDEEIEIVNNFDKYEIKFKILEFFTSLVK